MREFNYTGAPPEPSATPTTVYATEGLGRVVTAANVLVTIVLIVGIYFDNGSATIAVLAGIGYFGLSTTLTLLTLSGTLTHTIVNRQEQVTLRRYHQLQFMQLAAPPSLQLAAPPQLPGSPTADPLPAGLAPTSTFVAPIAEPDNSARREAVAWLLQLYGANGEPDPKKVLLSSDKERPGRVRVAVPSRPAKQYLLDHFIIHDLGNGYRLNLQRCPTISVAQNHLR